MHFGADAARKATELSASKRFTGRAHAVSALGLSFLRTYAFETPGYRGFVSVFEMVEITRAGRRL